MSEFVLKIDGVDMPSPTSYQWDLEDQSDADASRTEDGTMNKKRKGQVQALSYAWEKLTTAEASVILQAVQPEYMDVTFLSPLAGGSVTSNFYVGNRTAAYFNKADGYWENISFKFVERKMKSV